MNRAKTSERKSVPPDSDMAKSASSGHAPVDFSARPPAVIIVAPPWPRSGTARVIQNQIQYYRERGFFTAFIGVPFLWYFVALGENTKELLEGIDELGADRSFTATLDQKGYDAAKYKATIRHPSASPH